MSVIRIKKARDKPFVILDTTALNDARLSFRAKGIHTYLMAKPDDWQIHIEQLEKQSPREARDAIRSALGELEMSGYLRRQRIRGAKGRMMGWDTTIYETPLLAKLDAEDEALAGEAIGIETDVTPITDYPKSDEPMLERPKLDQPTSDEPTSAQPSSDNPLLLINDSTQNGVVPSIDSTKTPTNANALVPPLGGDDAGAAPQRPKKRAPPSQQPGTLDPNLIALILAMQVEEFHPLARETRLNEKFWDAQIECYTKRGITDFGELIRDVDTFYAANPAMWPRNENGARRRMNKALEVAFNKLHSRRKRYG